MTTPPDRPSLRISSPAGLLAVIPYLLGFIPTDSLVVVGAGRAVDRIQVAFRYDLPNPPDTGLAIGSRKRSNPGMSRISGGSVCPRHLAGPLRMRSQIVEEPDPPGGRMFGVEEPEWAVPVVWLP